MPLTVKDLGGEWTRHSSSILLLLINVHTVCTVVDVVSNKPLQTSVYCSSSDTKVTM